MSSSRSPSRSTEINRQPPHKAILAITASGKLLDFSTHTPCWHVYILTIKYCDTMRDELERIVCAGVCMRMDGKLLINSWLSRWQSAESERELHGQGLRSSLLFLLYLQIEQIFNATQCIHVSFLLIRTSSVNHLWTTVSLIIQYACLKYSCLLSYYKFIY